MISVDVGAPDQLSGLRLTDPVFSVPLGVRQTGMDGTMDGAQEQVNSGETVSLLR